MRLNMNIKPAFRAACLAAAKNGPNCRVVNRVLPTTATASTSLPMSIQPGQTSDFSTSSSSKYTTSGQMYSSEKRLTEETMSQNLRDMEYAVRGPVVAAADDLAQELKDNPDAFPNFDEILYTNVGNPHSVGQHALTWPREVMALCNLPVYDGASSADHNHRKMIDNIFNDDVMKRVQEIRTDDMDGKGTGSYSHSQGHPWFRQDICSFLEKRDNVPADPDTIFMTNGASKGIEMVLETLLADESKGLMLPIPQYPIYSALVSLRGAHPVGYYLDEDKGWSISIPYLEEELQNAKDKGIDVVGFVLINPGNPTGQVLSRKDLHVRIYVCGVMLFLISGRCCLFTKYSNVVLSSCIIVVVVFIHLTKFLPLSSF